MLKNDLEMCENENEALSIVHFEITGSYNKKGKTKKQSKQA